MSSSPLPTPSPSSSPRVPIKVLCITLGGDRRALIESMFSSPNLKNDFTLEFIDGVPSRGLRSKPGLMSHAYKSGLLIEDPSETFLVGKKTSQKGLWPDLDYAEELWRKGRSLNRERSVLACLMAHLNAMKYAVENCIDVIIEDNVRIIDSTDTYKIMRDLINASKDSGVRYFGYLGPKDNLEWLYKSHMPKYNVNECPFPFNEHYTDGVKRGTSLWGCYGYMVSSSARVEILERLQRDIGAVMWKGKRMKTYRIKPIDKIVPRRAHEAEMDVRISSKPVFFRAPMLTSKIHTKFDVEFCKSTEVQLKSIGVEWEELWLTAEEKSTVKMYRETGRWTEEEDRDEGKRDEREEEEKDEGVKVSKVVDEEDGGESNGTLRGVLVGAVGVGVLGGAILYLLANRKRRS